MPQPTLSAFFTRGARAVAHPSETDLQLLARFVATGEEAAFAELVHRHGPFVLAVCHRMIGDHQHAEDAFQATFLVLARRAKDVKSREGVRPFLYGVAVRVAKEARTVSARRYARESPVAALPDQPAEPIDTPDADVLRVLDQEVAALPDHLRVAVVLCELDCVARKEAAARLCIPEGTLSSRLAKARKLLAERLRKRGVTFPVAGLGVLAGSAPVSARLLSATAELVSPGAAVPIAVVKLSSGIIRMMFAQKLRIVLSLAAMTFVVVVSAAIAADPVQLPDKVQTVPTTGQTVPTTGYTVRVASPASKETPKALPKSPNKLLIRRGEKLAVMDADGKNETQLDIGPADSYPAAVFMQLSPDGSAIAIVAEVTEGEGLAAKRKRLPLHVRKVGEKEPGTDLGVQCQSFVWSADGNEIVCNEIDFKTDATKPTKPGVGHFIVNLKTRATTEIKLPNDQLITDWSRDGKYFLTSAFKGTPDRPQSRLFLMNRDGTEAKALTDEKQGAIGGRLSSDGTRVLYASTSPGEQPKPEMNVMTIATGKVMKFEGVPDMMSVQNFCWSPDGKKVAYTCFEVAKPGEDVDLESNIIVSDPDGKNPKTIVSAKSKRFAVVTVVDWR
jgi:RNA polymerase sigma factor (sigma-70 family)